MPQRRKTQKRVPRLRATPATQATPPDVQSTAEGSSLYSSSAARTCSISAFEAPLGLRPGSRLVRQAEAQGRVASVRPSVSGGDAHAAGHVRLDRGEGLAVQCRDVRSD